MPQDKTGSKVTTTTAKTTDFSSQTYWEKRFIKEKSFEWLANTKALEYKILDIVRDLNNQPRTQNSSDKVGLESNVSKGISGDIGKRINILHFGCGTSSLGPDLAKLFWKEDLNVIVLDADYAADSIMDRTMTTQDSMRKMDQEGDISLIKLDVLDQEQLKMTMPDEGWDLLIDKSTADAISCGPSIRSSLGRITETGWNELEGRVKLDGEDEDENIDDEWVEPIFVLCENLARVTRRGGKWLCISYSSTRFDHLKPTAPTSPISAQSESKGSSFCDNTNIEKEGSDSPHWKLLSATPVDGAFTGEPSTLQDEKGLKRVVYAPETNVWAYLLERV